MPKNKATDAPASEKPAATPATGASFAPLQTPAVPPSQAETVFAPLVTPGEKAK